MLQLNDDTRLAGWVDPARRAYVKLHQKLAAPKPLKLVLLCNYLPQQSDGWTAGAAQPIA